MSDRQIEHPAFIRLLCGFLIAAVAIAYYGPLVGLAVVGVVISTALAIAWVANLFQLDQGLRRWEVHLAGRCTHCGYDLRATPDRCPECGVVPGTDADG